MITVWITTTVFSSAALIVLSARTRVMLLKDVIETLGKDQEITADPERRNV